MTEAIIENKVLVWKLIRDVMSQILVWDEIDILIWKLLNDIQGIGRSDAHITVGL